MNRRRGGLTSYPDDDGVEGRTADTQDEGRSSQASSPPINQNFPFCHCRPSPSLATSTCSSRLSCALGFLFLATIYIERVAH